MEKLSLKMLIMLILFLSLVLPVGTIWADESTDPPVGDETDTFASVAADALIVLDLSGSMNIEPTGAKTYKYGNSNNCTADTTHCTGTGCSGGFCSASHTDCTVKCTRLDIAKRGIFSIMDDDNNNTIDVSDSASLGIRIGFMRFKDATGSCAYGTGNDTAGDYENGNIKLITKISLLGKETGTSYSLTYCGNSTSCASTVTSCTSGECIAAENACGQTPLASSLREAKLYLDAHKDKDTAAKACRQKFVILLTDGADTYSCGGNGHECQDHMYKRRREFVSATKALNDAGYKVFVIGFGASMPSYLSNTLEWAAYYGGIDNPSATNTGDTTAYNIPSGSTFPSGITTCTDDASPLPQPEANCIEDVSTVNQADFTSTNDPGYLNLSGYAFLATNASELSNALRSAIATIRDQSYSFTRVSVQTVRTPDENFIYEASFLPLMEDAVKDPFWIGYLKKYQLNDDGTLVTPAEWDAGAILQARTGSARTIYTLLGGSLVAFNTVTAANLGVDTAADPTASRNGIVNFIYNGELVTAYAYSGWKLGDIFHSSPISIGSPSDFYKDIYDPEAYVEYRDDHQRTSDNGKRLIVAGANDGQFHFFKAGKEADGGGSELWSFIPPNLLPRLQGLYHTAHPTSLSHQYYVDGPATASDIWTGTGDGTDKSSDEWKAYLIISEGRGGTSTLWSSSANCDSGFSASYSATYNQYCGYYAFDVTDTTSAPVFKWHFGGTGGLTATQGAHLGQPWSKITMGRLKISGNERWVGFAAGGYAGTECKPSSCDTRGKGFYVIDLKTGNVLWTFTRTSTNLMDYSLVGQPASVDVDDDGYIDTVYSADLGGNVWRFKMCTKAEMDASTCTSDSDWTGGLFFEATSSGNIRPIYTKPTVVHSLSGDLWVYFGTGDVTDPTAPNAQEVMYAVKDNSRSGTYGASNLSNITSEGNTYDPADNGWRMNMPGMGIKILADPVVYADVVYFTTYTPGNYNDLCDRSGDAKLYAVDYVTGAGQFAGGARSTYAGEGIASGAVISENPKGGTNVYVTTSEGSQINALQPPDPTANRANLQYWHDMRVQ